jgi:hypothetical protein
MMPEVICRIDLQRKGMTFIKYHNQVQRDLIKTQIKLGPLRESPPRTCNTDNIYADFEQHSYAI